MVARHVNWRLREADQSDAVRSPDGRYVAYVENHNGTFDLRVVQAGGGQPRVLVAPDEGVVDTPAWSPDGREISYTFGYHHSACGSLRRFG